MLSLSAISPLSFAPTGPAVAPATRMGAPVMEVSTFGTPAPAWHCTRACFPKRPDTPAAAAQTISDLKTLAQKSNPALGFWDPLRLSEYDQFQQGEEAAIGFLRHAEIKHGRVASARTTSRGPDRPPRRLTSRRARAQWRGSSATASRRTASASRGSSPARPPSPTSRLRAGRPTSGTLSRRPPSFRSWGERPSVPRAVMQRAARRPAPAECRPSPRQLHRLPRAVGREPVRARAGRPDALHARRQARVLPLAQEVAAAPGSASSAAVQPAPRVCAPPRHRADL